MQYLNLLQWPATFVTLWAAWFAASSLRRRRKFGFWLYLVSNVLWVIWSLSAHAYALIVLQLGLVIMNIRGASENEAPAN